MKRTSAPTLITVLAALLAHTAAQAQDVPAAGVLIRAPAARPQESKVVKTLAVPGAGPLAGLEDVPIDYAFASVGRGYDPISNRILDIECVEGTQADEQLPTGATLIRSNYSIVSDNRGHASASSSSVSFGAVIKAVSLGFGTSSSRGTSFNNVDQFVRVYSRIATRGTERRLVRWTPRALQLLRNDLPEFLRQCGTRYVRAVYAGHLLDLTGRFALRSNQTSSATATSLSIGVAKLFSVGGASASAETEAKTYADLTVDSQSLGALAIVPAPTADVGPVETLMKFYNNGFLTAVTAAPTQGALPLYIVSDRYVDKDGLSYRNRVPTWTDQLITAVVAKSDSYNDLVTAISTLNYVLEPSAPARLTLFLNTDAAGAQAKLTEAKSALADFSAAVTYCQQLMTAGKEFPAAGKSAVSLCQDRLQTALPDSRLLGVKLVRSYS